MLANTNYSWDLLTNALWTASRSLNTEWSYSIIPNASHLALYRAINSWSSSVPCNSTSNATWNLWLSFATAKQWKTFLIQWQIQPLTSPRRSSGRNSSECLVRFNWLRTCVPPSERTHDSWSHHVAKAFLRNKYYLKLIISSLKKHYLLL